jgi:hypothetical protein
MKKIIIICGLRITCRQAYYTTKPCTDLFYFYSKKLKRKIVCGGAPSWLTGFYIKKILTNSRIVYNTRPPGLTEKSV